MLSLPVVTSKSVDSAFDKNESKLGILVLSEFLQVLANVNSLLNHVVEIFWDLRGEASLLQDSQNFATSDTFNLGNTIAISEDNTDLRW